MDRKSRFSGCEGGKWQLYLSVSARVCYRDARRSAVGFLDWSSAKKSNVLIGPHSSIGSPITFMIRPSVARPTGI